MKLNKNIFLMGLVTSLVSMTMVRAGLEQAVDEVIKFATESGSRPFRAVGEDRVRAALYQMFPSEHWNNEADEKAQDLMQKWLVHPRFGTETGGTYVLPDRVREVLSEHGAVEPTRKSIKRTLVQLAQQFNPTYGYRP